MLYRICQLWILPIYNLVAETCQNWFTNHRCLCTDIYSIYLLYYFWEAILASKFCYFFLTYAKYSLPQNAGLDSYYPQQVCTLHSYYLHTIFTSSSFKCCSNLTTSLLDTACNSLHVELWELSVLDQYLWLQCLNLLPQCLYRWPQYLHWWP